MVFSAINPKEKISCAGTIPLSSPASTLTLVILLAPSSSAAAMAILTMFRAIAISCTCLSPEFLLITLIKPRYPICNTLTGGAGDIYDVQVRIDTSCVCLRFLQIEIGIFQQVNLVDEEQR